MTEINTILAGELAGFIDKYVAAYQKQYSHLPLIEHDADWPSPCISSSFKEGEYDYWRPVPIIEELSFDNIENALELKLHTDIKAYFTQFYSDSLDASCSEGELSLLMAWSDKDFERLQENIVGHVLMKKRLKQEPTIFFAVTSEEDHIISIKNDSGEVWVERVGKTPHKKLSGSLAEFLAQLTPRIP